MADLRAVAEEGAPCHGLWASGREVWDEGMRNLMKFGKSGIQRRLKAEGKRMFVTQEAVSGDISYIRNENPCSIPCVRTVAQLQGFSSRVLFFFE